MTATTPTTPTAPTTDEAAATPTPTPTWTTALVTGASSGIGREVARRLAAEGTELVLVARDTRRLEEVAAEVAATHGRASEVLTADLGGPAQLATVEARLADAERPVDLLVNSAGFGTYGRFVELDIDGEQQEVAVNVVALMRLTHAALGPMLARGRGAVLNVSSVAGLQATPGNATYGASKAFVATFSEAVHEELKGTGVSLTCVLPGFTRTEFQQRAGIEGREIPGPLWQTAEQCVGEALAATRAGKPWVVPGVLNKVAAAAAGTVPRSLTRRIAARVASRL